MAVSQQQAKIATSSVSPYMWMSSGPMWKLPELGEGMNASIAPGFCLVAPAGA